jgi:hypothetical protein
MTEQLLLTLIAASCGFVASVCFAYASAFTSKEKLVAVSKTYWGFNLVFAQATVAQSTQYLVGSLLLFFSFGLQIVAVLASSTNYPALPQVLNYWLSIVVCSLVLFGGLAYFACKKLYKWRISQVEAMLKESLK